MKNDDFWEWFCDTGDPVCWLIYRQACARGEYMAVKSEESGIPLI